MSLSTCEFCGGHIPLGPDAINRCEKCGRGVFEAIQAPNGRRIFKFDMGARVKGIFAGEPFTGKIISRLESHTGGIHYAVYGDEKFRGGEQSEWLSEKELEAINTEPIQPALGL